MLEDEAAFTLLPSAAGAEQALRLAHERVPDIALLDVSLEDGDGLRLCLELKRLAVAPVVLLYTASADPLLGVKGRLVGADGLLPKTALANELRKAIVAALVGEPLPLRYDGGLLRAKMTNLSPELLTIVGLRLNSTPLDGIGEVLGLTEKAVADQISRLLEIL